MLRGAGCSGVSGFTRKVMLPSPRACEEVRGLSSVLSDSWTQLFPIRLACDASRYTVKKLKILAPLHLNFMLTLPYIYLNNSTEAIVLPFLPPSFLPSFMFAECIGIESNE